MRTISDLTKYIVIRIGLLVPLLGKQLANRQYKSVKIDRTLTYEK